MKNLYKALAYFLGGILAVWLTAKILLPVGLPFLLGWLLAALAAPATKRISRRIKLPYALISFVCLTLLTAVIVLIFWLLGRLLLGELEELGRQLPSFLASLEQPLSTLRKKLLQLAAKLPDGAAGAATQWVERLFEGSSVIVDSASQWMLSLATNIIAWVPDLILFLLTMVLSAYLFAAQAPSIKAFFQKRVPSEWAQKLQSISSRLKTALAGYAKAQLKLSALTFAIVALGLLILQRSNAVLLALIIAFVDALPVFGAGTILIPWGVISFLSGASATAIGLIVLYAVAALSRTVLEPRFLGKQIGLSPLLTLIALYAGYRFFGILGMVLFPIAAILTKQLYDLIESA